MLQRNKKINSAKVIASCFDILWKSSKSYTLLRLITKIFLPFINILHLLLTKNIIDILAYEPEVGKVLLYVCLIGLISIVNIVANRFISYISIIHDDLIEKYLNGIILEKTLSSDASLYDNPDLYNKLNLSIQNQNSISDILWRFLDLISAVISCSSAVILLSNASIIYSFILLLAVFPITIINWKYTRIIYNLNIKQMNDEREKDYLFTIASSKIFSLDIRFFWIKNILKEKYNSIWTRLYEVRKHLLKKKMILSISFESLPELVVSLITIDIVLKICRRELSIGEFTFYTGLITQFVNSIFIFVNNLMSIYDNKIKIDSTMDFLSIPCNIESEKGKEIREIKEIQFDNVYFKYPGTDQFILKNLSFTIHKGDKIALIGLNGSGKSTIIKLIMRFYDVNEGSIIINGENINKFNVKDLRKLISAYIQDSPNYSFTVRENKKF